MRTLSSDALAALAQPVVPLAQLVLIEGFSGGDAAFNTSNRRLTFDGTEYRGAWGVASISEITDAPGEVKGVQMEISAVDSARLALVLDEADEFQGAPVTIRTALIDASTGAVVDAPVEWTGFGDTMDLQETGETASAQATFESAAVDLLRGHPSTYSDGDQQARYPGDRAFEFVTDQADKPVVWPKKEWFYT